MKKYTVLLALLTLLLAAVPALAAPAVVFEPEPIFFVIDKPLDEQAATSVDVSIDGSEIKAIRFGTNASVSVDLFPDPLSLSPFFASSDVTGGAARVTFHSDIPAFAGSQTIRVRLYSDESATVEITSDDLSVRFDTQYGMAFEEPPAIVSGESVDITIEVTFNDNVTGEEDLVLSLSSLISLDNPYGMEYADLGLTFTPNAATSTIRITSDAAKIGSEIFWFRATSDQGSIRDSGFDIEVTEHALTLSISALFAMPTEEVDYYVTYVKRPAETPLASFDVVMEIVDGYYDENDPDSVAAFATISTDQGALRWNGLSIDLEEDASRLRIYGTAEQEWVGELSLKGWLEGGDMANDPDFDSNDLDINTHKLEAGDLLEVDKRTLSDPDGNSRSRMALDVVNTVTIPLSYDIQQEGGIEVVVRTPSGTMELLTDDDLSLSSLSANRGAGTNLVIGYTPLEAGDYAFRFLYAQVVGETLYYQDMKVGAGSTDSGSSSGCNTGFAALSLVAAGAIALRKRR